MGATRQGIGLAGAVLALGLAIPSAGLSISVPEPPSPTPQPSVIKEPELIDGPTGRSMKRFFPIGAMLRGIKGRVVLHCGTDADRQAGSIKACEVVSETPSGHGFAPAAMGLTRLHRVKPLTIDDTPIPTTAIEVVVTFDRSTPEDIAITARRPRDETPAP